MLLQKPGNVTVATSDPTVNHDSVHGYSVGDFILNTTDVRLFQAKSVAVGAADWRQICLAGGDFRVAGNNATTIARFIQISSLNAGDSRICIGNTVYPGIFSMGANTGGGANLSYGAYLDNWFINMYPGGLYGGLLFGTNSTIWLRLYASGGLSHGVDTNPGAGNAYFNGSVSASQLIDRTRGFKGDAIALIKLIKNDAEGNIDHSTLPAFVRVSYKRPITINKLVPKYVPLLNADGTIVSDKDFNPIIEQKMMPEMQTIAHTDATARSVGDMVTIQTVALQQLIGRVEHLESEIKKLKGSVS